MTLLSEFVLVLVATQLSGVNYKTTLLLNTCYLYLQLRAITYNQFQCSYDKSEWYYAHLSCMYTYIIGPSSPRALFIVRGFHDRIELNWLPPTEPNGEVLHYVIYYTPEGGTEQSIDTGSDLTHYNLTGLERNRVYTNIAVQAVNSAGRSDGSAVIAQYNHTPPGESCCIIIVQW